ncbi:hypothetical protein SUGI_0356630 [Cryptomeria japonica]|uniref:aspartic proteinase nepenthesin-2-like n=1 Tax=Cryptomeria japonica TaxID=3369 RepID=UPI002408F091|nr:aspartic proteinase nepenthesin-2-like [Cryptomeria japonica]GLJ19687.1 hypothetical protein SUGI_0356630 [Cryptomeria japonica]
MAYNKLITLVMVNLTICCFCSLLCAEEAHGGPHLEKNFAIIRLKRMEASIKAVQSGRTKTQVSGGVAPLTRYRTTIAVTIGIGTPLSKDKWTQGSDLIWFQCAPCTQCSIGSKFLPEFSSTYRRLPCSSSLCSTLGNSTCAPDCQYSHIYSQNWSMQGDLSYETFTMADTTEAAHSFGGVAFGCSHGIQGDGVKYNDATIISVEGISVGNVSLNIPRATFDIQANGSGGFIIDSGTPYTVLPHAAFTAVASVFDSILALPRTNESQDGLSLCYSSYYDGYVPHLNMTFHMRGADYVIEGKRNFIKFSGYQHPSVVCLAMLEMDEASVAGVPAVLGSFQQQDYHILYDNANQRLSFTLTRCRSLYMSSYPSYQQSKAPILRIHAVLLLLLITL